MLTDALPLPPGDFCAYLFDLDGTVADTMPQHYLAWSATLAAHGANLPKALFYEWGGIPPLRVVELLNERFGYQLDPEAMMRDKEARFLLGVEDVKPIASMLAHILEAHGRIPLAIVSGSPRENVVQILGRLGLTDRFKALVCAEDYRRGKPDPEPFLAGAAALGVAPKRCLVFEDAEPGIAAAQAAGMQWVRVPATLPAT